MAGYPPGLFSNSAQLRQHVSDMVRTVMTGGHSDELDSSQTSLHLSDTDDMSVQFYAVEGYLWCYYGDIAQYPVVSVSDLVVDDRMLKPQGHIGLAETTKQVYKAFSVAINRKMFRLDVERGPYDCCNTFFANDNTSYATLVGVGANKLLPYYYKHGSPIRGFVVFDEILGEEEGGNAATRRIRIVYVRATGNLDIVIPDGTFVYLGGDHSSGVIGATSEGTPVAELKSCKYFEVRSPVMGCRDPVKIASPFQNTWGSWSKGANVAVCVLRNGHYLYWATDTEPREGWDLDRIGVENIPIGAFPSSCIAINQTLPAEELAGEVLGVWVMQGLVLSDGKGKLVDCPTGALSRFRGGFFRVKMQEIVPTLHVQRKVEHAVKSFERLGAKIFGFEDIDNGAFRCNFVQLSEFLKLPEEALAAYIAGNGSSSKYFGACSFAAREMRGPIKLTGTVNTGIWLAGNVETTGTGLVYLPFGRVYFTVETIAGVSKIRPYNGGGIETRTEGRIGNRMYVE